METPKDVVDFIESVLNNKKKGNVISTKPFRRNTEENRQQLTEVINNYVNDCLRRRTLADENLLRDMVTTWASTPAAAEGLIGLITQELQRNRNVAVDGARSTLDTLATREIDRRAIDAAIEMTENMPYERVQIPTTQTTGTIDEPLTEQNSIAINQNGRVTRVPISAVSMDYDQYGGGIITINDPILREQLNGNNDVTPETGWRSHLDDYVNVTTLNDRLSTLQRYIDTAGLETMTPFEDSIRRYILDTVSRLILEYELDNRMGFTPVPPPTVFLLQDRVGFISNNDFRRLDYIPNIPLIFNGVTYTFLAYGIPERARAGDIRDCQFYLTYPADPAQLMTILYHLFSLNAEGRRVLFNELCASYMRHLNIIQNPSRYLGMGPVRIPSPGPTSLRDIYPEIVVEDEDPHDSFQQQ